MILILITKWFLIYVKEVFFICRFNLIFYNQTKKMKVNLKFKKPKNFSILFCIFNGFFRSLDDDWKMISFLKHQQTFLPTHFNVSQNFNGFFFVLVSVSQKKNKIKAGWLIRNWLVWNLMYSREYQQLSYFSLSNATQTQFTRFHSLLFFCKRQFKYKIVSVIIFPKNLYMN